MTAILSGGRWVKRQSRIHTGLEFGHRCVCRYLAPNSARTSTGNDWKLHMFPTSFAGIFNNSVTVLKTGDVIKNGWWNPAAFGVLLYKQWSWCFDVIVRLVLRCNVHWDMHLSGVLDSRPSGNSCIYIFTVRSRPLWVRRPDSNTGITVTS